MVGVVSHSAFLRGCFACLLIGLTLPFSAFAAVWRVDAERSFVEFSALYGKDEIKGRFPRFTADIRLDPEHPREGVISAVVSMRDVAVEDDDAAEHLPKAEWLDTERYPEARFTGTEIRAAGEGRYVAKGMLTLKGVSFPLALPFTLALSDDRSSARAEAAATVSRLAYRIGLGEWEDASVLADAVRLRIVVVADHD